MLFFYIMFRWVKDGVEFDPSKDPELSVSRDSGTFSLTAKDGPIHQYQGRYNCYASNDLGTAVSNEINVLPVPTMAKVSKKVEEGESVVLPCNPPNSTVAPVIHWMDKKLRHIQQNDRVIQGRDGNLYFSHVTEADSRDDYTCNTQFPSARIIVLKEPIKLTVVPSNSVVRNRRPQMMRPTGSHSSYLVLSGQNLELECIVQGLPSPKIQWIRKDGVLSESRTSKDSYDRVLRFKNISESDSGEYQCTATNLQGMITHTYSITVEAAPYWIKKPKSQLYAPGDTVKLDCKADGIPTPDVTWSINGNLLTDPKRSLKHGVLTLKNVELSDTAVYQCKAVNKHGSILINAYVYVIELPPQILTEDGLMYSVAEGQTTEMACETFGSPQPNVTWEGETWGALVANPRMSQLPDGSLQISNASLNDSGQYTCTVSNSKITITAELDVLNKTVIVKPPLALRIQRGKPATLTCEYQVDSRQYTPQVQWRKNGQKLTESSDSDKYMIDESTLIIPEVKEEDEGIYTCEVITTLDMAEASGSITIVDRPDSPTQIQMTEPKDRSVTLSWTPGDHHNSPVLGTVNVFLFRQQFKCMQSVLDRATLSLKPFLSYRFRVIAINDIGKSDPSMYTDVFSTPAAPPDSNPEGVRSDSIDPGNLVITWKEMDRHSFNGPGFRYKVMWRKVLGSGPSWHTKFMTSPPFTVTDVGNFSAFDIKVQAVNEMGEGPEPKSTIGYSGEDYPIEAPMDVGVALINSTTVVVKWAPINRETVRGRLQGYKIYLMHYGPESRHLRQERVREGKPSNISFLITDSNEERKVLGDLQPYSHYGLSVSVFNNKGEGPQSDPLTFHTPEGVPGPPSSLLLDSPSETEMTLHWTPPTQPNGVLKGYTLKYQQVDKEDSPMQMIEISDHVVSHFSLKLDPHSRYRFYLRGYTAKGEGLPIIREGATTLDGGPPSNISLSTGETSVNLTWVSKERQRNVGFFIHYLKKDGTWKRSERVNSSQSFYTLQGLQSGSEYRLKIDLKNKTLWEDEIQTAGASNHKTISQGFVTESWFIGLISALVLLLLVLLILCFIKRSKGGKYSVKEKEEGQIDSEVRPMNNEAFGEYRCGDEKQTASQPSLCEDSKLCTDDTLDDYANSMQTEVIMDESLASQSSRVRDVPDPGTQESSPLNPATPGRDKAQTWIHTCARLLQPLMTDQIIENPQQ
uniref:L1 cell adhesion molecule, paralog a n=1 Tax=Cyprinus carpio TaxID=7962 RepID=A0A8C1PEY8_CYPCA